MWLDRAIQGLQYSLGPFALRMAKTLEEISVILSAIWSKQVESKTDRVGNLLDGLNFDSSSNLR